MNEKVELIEPVDSSSNVILIVDDEESIRKTLKYMLAKVGYQVLTAAHATIAYEILDKTEVDLVISDIVMPDISGLSLVKYINKQYRPPQILLITGEPTLETATSAVKLGVFDYIAKPVKKRALLDVVHQALEKKFLLDEKERLIQQNMRYLQDLEEKLDQRTYRLLITEEKYRSLFDNTNVGIGISGKDSKMLEVNPVLCRIYGFSPDEFRNVRLAEIWVDQDVRLGFNKMLNETGSVEQYEAEFYRANKSTFWASMTAKNIKYRDEEALLTTILDISARKASEIGLKKALDDKEEMLREIHHRTKNNMNVIISLLNMQSYASDNKDLKGILEKVNDRIYSMSLVHEQIYLSRGFSAMDLPKYLDALIMRHYTRPKVGSGNISIEKHFDEVKIGLSQAIPLGLTLNELIANALKHSLKVDQNTQVDLTLSNLVGNQIGVKIQDNGNGFPSDFNLQDPSSLGLHMVKILVEDQLCGNLSISNDGGAVVEFQFALDKIVNGDQTSPD